MGRPRRELAGQKFGQWLVLDFAGSTSRGAATWNVECDCGARGVVIGNSLTAGKQFRCRACRRMALMTRTPASGMSKTRTYKSWLCMNERCYRPNSTSYPRYGGRGIAVCERWRNSFANFFADMGERPAATSLDRINCNDGYSPENCRWSDIWTQNRNRRSSKLNEEDVREIRRDRAQGVLLSVIAKKFGIAACSVSGIAKGREWVGV